MKALIIEDEPLVADELINSIAQVDPGIKIITTLGSVKTALRWFTENAEPDVIFADVELADGLSFYIFERFQLSCPIIFTTAYNEYAIQAFKANGIDYLLKPVDWGELRVAISKSRAHMNIRSKVSLDIQKIIDALSQPTAAAPSYFKEHFLGNFRNTWVPVRTSDIAYFMRDELIFMVTQDKERYILDHESLEEVEELLDSKQFYRVNRQSIVNILAVHSVKGLANLKMTLTLKAPNHHIEFDISRSKAPSFRKWLEK